MDNRVSFLDKFVGLFSIGILCAVAHMIYHTTKRSNAKSFVRTICTATVYIDSVLLSQYLCTPRS